ncbi:hypothetical protein GGER_01100 [Serratia rubidaea]
MRLRFTGDVDNIGDGQPHRGGDFAQNGDAGVSLRFLHLHQHAFTDAGAARQFIERQLLLAAKFPDAPGDGGAYRNDISARLGRFIDFLVIGR